MSFVDVSLGAVGRSAPLAAESEERLAVAPAWTRSEVDANPRFPRAGGQVVPRPLEGDAIVNPREAFLVRVKQAVVQGNRAGAAPRLPEHTGVGYQGAGQDPVQRFCQELAAAGGKGHTAADAAAVLQTIQSILQSHNARKILLSQGGVIERLDLSAKLNELGIDARTLDDLPGDP